MFSSFPKMLVLVISLLSIFVFQCVNAQGIFKDKSFEYHVMSSTPVNHLYSGKILGVAHNEESRIVSTQILKGELPEGISIFDDGTLVANRKMDKVLPDKYKVKAEFIDGTGKRFTRKIKFELLKPAHTDIEASVHIAKSKLNKHYQAGDIIAQFHDPNGAITEAKLIKGSIPHGVMLVQNKAFVVARPKELKDGAYFCLFFLKDQKGGNSVIAVSLPVGVQTENL